MTRVIAAQRPRLSGRFLVAVGVAFVAQLALLIFSGSNHVPVKAVPKPAVGYDLIAPLPGDWTALNDPTLFVLPHELGFSGAAWMIFKPLEFSPRSWTEPTRELPLDVQSLGQTFVRYVTDAASENIRLPALPQPALTYPRLTTTPQPRMESRLRIAGEIASRRLLNPEPLPAVTEAFTNTVVEILVDPEGYVFSSVLSAPSGSTNDWLALNIAQSRRFEPIAPVGPDRETQPPAPMMQGTLIFEWRPAPRTTPASALP